jgi:hypothetical protein
MLPATFDSDPLLRVARSVLGIFAVALLTAGFSITGLLAFAVRDPVYQAEALFLPSLTACVLGLLTIFYDFLISSRFTWTTPALLLTVAAAVSTVIYGGLLVWTYRRIYAQQFTNPIPFGVNIPPVSLGSDLAGVHAASNNSYQPPGYYENYVRNMYPASAHAQSPPATSGPGDDVNNITEEEMQRQQMLMLLLAREEAPTPDPSQSTFHIDWQGQENDDSPRPAAPGTPVNGYYAPNSGQPESAWPQTAYPRASGSVHAPRPRHVRQWTSDSMRPWDGVWRGVSTASSGTQSGLSISQATREDRRRQIEMGYH